MSAYTTARPRKTNPVDNQSNSCLCSSLANPILPARSRQPSFRSPLDARKGPSNRQLPDVQTPHDPPTTASSAEGFGPTYRIGPCLQPPRPRGHARHEDGPAIALRTFAQDRLPSNNCQDGYHDQRGFNRDQDRSSGCNCVFHSCMVVRGSGPFRGQRRSEFARLHEALGSGPREVDHRGRSPPAKRFQPHGRLRLSVRRPSVPQRAGDGRFFPRVRFLPVERPQGPSLPRLQALGSPRGRSPLPLRDVAAVLYRAVQRPEQLRPHGQVHTEAILDRYRAPRRPSHRL